MRKCHSVLLLCLGACGATTATPSRCATTCVADPQPHCIVDDVCTDDADCPSGLSCSSRDDAVGGPLQPKACRWSPPVLDRLALVNGFATQTMALEVTSSPELGLVWMNPRDALFVACAVFTCNPVIRVRANDSGNPSDEPPTGETTLWQIANADACMFELHATDTSRSSLPLDGKQRAPETPACSPVPPHDHIYDRVIDFFAAGCWAYDSHEVIAASELVPIAAVDMARVAPTTPVNATCAHEYDLCYDATHQFYGACMAGTCEPRCITAQDCELAATQLLHEPGDTTWECHPVATSLAGICTPLRPVRRVALPGP